MKNRELTPKGQDSLSFKFLKLLVRLAIHKPHFIYLGDKITRPSLILSNHVGSRAPLTLEVYAPFKTRLIGAYQMTGSLKDVYHYLAHIYWHQKAKMNLSLAKFCAFFACPLVYGTYKGLKVIPSYGDFNFIKSVKSCYRVVNEFKENLVIFPEDSNQGYFDKLTHFYSGFAVIADYCLKQGLDLDIYLAYYSKHTRNYYFDQPIKYSELKKKYPEKEAMAEALRIRCNQLGDLDNK